MKRPRGIADVILREVDWFTSDAPLSDDGPW